MRFEEKIQKQFKKAGWFEGRNIAATYENANILRYIDFPQFLKDFLKEYGNLEIEDCKNYQSNITNILKLGVAYAGYDKDEHYKQDFAVHGKILYPFGYFYPDNYMIACDETGNLYMLGDYTFLRANNFKEGIEKLLFDDWSGTVEYDEENNIWKSSRSF